MKKETILGIVLILSIFLAMSIYAEGNGEGGDLNNTDTNSTNNETNTNSTNETIRNETETNNNSTTNSTTNSTSPNTNLTNSTNVTRPMKNCDLLPKEEGRIRCRLKYGQNYTAPPGEVPEACRLDNPEKRGRCVAFYNAIQKCYIMHGEDKDLCFKKASGLKKKFSEEGQEERKQKARDYMITLLYDLEERAEKFNQRGKLTEDQTTEIIVKIVEVKKAILEGKTKEEIRPMLQELKTLWRSSVTRQVETEVENE